MHSTAFYIQKGGVGKSTPSDNVAWKLSESKKTILIDADPQGNISSWFLSEPPQYELADILTGGCSTEDGIIQISGGLSLIPTFGLDGSLKQYAENTLNDEPFIFEDLNEALSRLGYEIIIYSERITRVRQQTYRININRQSWHIPEKQVDSSPSLQSKTGRLTHNRKYSN